MKQIVDKPSPITGGLLELCTEPAIVSYRGENISYEKSFYRCVDSGLEFTDEELENTNLNPDIVIWRWKYESQIFQLKGTRPAPIK